MNVPSNNPSTRVDEEDSIMAWGDDDASLQNVSMKSVELSSVPTTGSQIPDTTSQSSPRKHLSSGSSSVQDTNSSSNPSKSNSEGPQKQLIRVPVPALPAAEMVGSGETPRSQVEQTKLVSPR